jgi:hypothetical protein
MKYVRRAWVLLQEWLLDRCLFRFRRGATVGVGATRTRCTVVWQRYQTRDVLGPLVRVKDKDGCSVEQFAQRRRYLLRLVQSEAAHE